MNELDATSATPPPRESQADGQSDVLLAEALDDRIRRGPIVLKRESLPDGGERVTYRNMLP